jgi:hypothetical protein
MPIALRRALKTALVTTALAGGGLLTLLAAGPVSAQTARPAAAAATAAPASASTSAPAPGTTPGVALFTPAASGNAVAHLAYTGRGGGVYLGDALAPAQPAVSLGGHLIGGPSVVLVPPGVLSSSQTGDELAVFGRGTDNALWWTHQTASGWTGWRSLGGGLTSKPGAAASEFGDHGKLAVFARGTDGLMWYKSLGSSGWGAWKYLGGGNLLAGAGPAAAYDDNGHLVLTAVGSDKAVYLWADFAGFGFAFGDMGGQTTSDPGLAFVHGTAQAPNARLAVLFARGTDGALWSKQVTLPVPTLAGAWHSLGGSLTSGVSADSNGLTFVLGLGTDHEVWMRGGAWPSLRPWTRG